MLAAENSFLMEKNTLLDTESANERQEMYA